MKKHNEGYVLPLVMVVLVILSAFALSVLAPAVSNLKAQQASIERTKQRFLMIADANESIAVFQNYSFSNAISTPNHDSASLVVDSLIANAIEGDGSADGHPGLIKQLKSRLGDTWTPQFQAEYPKLDAGKIDPCDTYYLFIDSDGFSEPVPSSNPMFDASVHFNDVTFLVTFKITPVINEGVIVAYECAYTVETGSASGSYTISTKGGD